MSRLAAASAALLLLVATSCTAAEMSVTVTDGPKECDDSDKVKPGDFLSMHYTGTIDASSPVGEQGAKFDSSRDRGQTFDFEIGAGQVIRGWDEGLLGLCKGASATLILPADYAYGDRGAGGKIPGGATLRFEVEVVDVGVAPKRAPPPNLFKQLDTDGDGKLSKDEINAYFVGMGQPGVPDGLWESEDKDKDGFVSWDEFSGPKEDPPAGDEL